MPDNSLKKLIDLAKLEGNKFFVLDENGEPQLVMMSVEEYERLLVQKLAGQIADIEDINKKITEAQADTLSAKDLETARKREYQDQLKSEVIDSTFSFEPEPDELD